MDSPHLRGASHVVLGAMLGWALASCAAPRALAHDGSQAASADGATLQTGSLALHRCDTPAPWCAVLERALDPSGAAPGTIPIYFEFYPHTASGRAVGTLVATEGGPGYPATESRDAYLALYAPLRARSVVAEGPAP